jgi:hypothetical protein
MVFAALLLLLPFPQVADKAVAVSAAPVLVAGISEKDSSLSRELPAMPQPKVKMDTDKALADANSASDSSAGSAPASSTPANPNASSAANPSPSAKPIQPGPASQPSPLKLATTRPYENPSDRKAWYALVVAGHSAAVLDAWSTRRAISQGYGTEANPLLRPFSHSNAMYAATQVSPLVMDYLGKRMMVSRHPLLRKWWWVPQTLGATVSFSAGINNIGLVH